MKLSSSAKLWPDAATAAALLLIFRFWNPPDNPTIRLCGFYWLTELPCPFCGITRGLCAAAKGEWGRAMSFHAFSPMVLIGIIIWLSISLTGFNPVPRLWKHISACAFVVYGVLRIVLA